MRATFPFAICCVIPVAAPLSLAACATDEAVAAATAPAAPTLDQVIARNTAARGGAAALDKLRSIAIDVEIVEGGQTLVGRWAATADGLVRIDIYADGKNVYSEGVDRKGVWRWTGGPEPAEPSVADGAANALTNGAETRMFGWHRYAGRGNTMTLKAPMTIDGVAYDVVEVKFATGQLADFFLDRMTGQIVRRRDERAYHPDNDQTKQRIESIFLDYTSVDGILDSHRSEDRDMTSGKTLATSRVLKREINPSFSPDHFERNRRAPERW